MSDAGRACPYLLLRHLDTQTSHRAEDEGAQASSPFLRDHDAQFLADSGWDEHLQGYFGLVLNGHRRCNAAGSDLGLCCGSGRANIRSRARGRRRNRLQQCSEFLLVMRSSLLSWPHDTITS